MDNISDEAKSVTMHDLNPMTVIKALHCDKAHYVTWIKLVTKHKT